MTIANVTLNNTYDEWRSRTNQLIHFVNDVESGNLARFYSNSSVLTISQNISRTSNNYININVSSSILDTSALNVATASMVNTVATISSRSFDTANLGFDQANTANATAILGFNQANTARVHANVGFDQANTARDIANAAYNAANNAVTDFSPAYIQANTARDLANTAGSTANLGFAQANTARDTANLGFTQANTARDTANLGLTQATTARDHANLAFAKANTALANTDGITTAGSLNVSGTLATSAANVAGNLIVNSRIGIGVSPTATFDLNGTYAQNVITLTGGGSSGNTIDCSIGNFFRKDVAAANTFFFENVVSSRAYAFTLELNLSGSAAITWPSSVRWPANTAPTLTVGRTHILTFLTDDGGTIWRASSILNYLTT